MQMTKKIITLAVLVGAEQSENIFVMLDNITKKVTEDKTKMDYLLQMEANIQSAPIPIITTPTTPDIIALVPGDKAKN